MPPSSQRRLSCTTFDASRNTDDGDVEATANTQPKEEAEGHKKSTKDEDDAKAPRKEQSVLQAKLTKLAIQIGYGGTFRS